MSNTSNRFTIHEDGTVGSAYILASGRITFDLDGFDFDYVQMTIHSVAHLYKILPTPSSEHTEAGWKTAYYVTHTGLAFLDHKPTTDEQEQLKAGFRSLADAMINQWSTLEALLLEYTYIWLRNRIIPKGKPIYEQASNLASIILEEEIRPDAWRMRLKKWAMEQGLPPIEQRQRKTG